MNIEWSNNNNKNMGETIVSATQNYGLLLMIRATTTDTTKEARQFEEEEEANKKSESIVWSSRI